VPVHSSEQWKTLSAVEELSRALASAGADRDALVVAVGGGVVGDVAGFIAASWMRGVRWIAVPTTLLGMVDAALGGKTAVNLSMADGTLAKNMIGAIWQPRAVVSDVSSLASLPERALRAGIAECVKHAMLADAGLLDDLAGLASLHRADAHARAGAVQAIARAAQVKLDIVARDEREHEDRMLLNLGHTLAWPLASRRGCGDRARGGDGGRCGGRPAGGRCAPADRYGCRFDPGMPCGGRAADGAS